MIAMTRHSLIMMMTVIVYGGYDNDDSKDGSDW